MPHRPPPRRHRPGRRLVWIAAGVSLLVHVAILGLVVLHPPAAPPGARTILLAPAMPESDVSAAATETPSEPSTPEQDRSAPDARPAPPIETPAVAVPTPSPRAPESATIPQTGLVQLRSPVLPLIATPYGIGRRPFVRDEARLARMRAESLVNARIATIIEVRPPVQAGPVSLANGGVSIPVPWGGFIRDDRDDGAWREKRCRGDEKEKGDEAGEEEARRTQCG